MKMSGFEISAIASKAFEFLGMAVAFIDRVRNAHDHQIELANVLENYKHEIRTTAMIVSLVERGKELQIVEVASVLVEIRNIGGQLCISLEALLAGEEGTFARQLARESDGEMGLPTTMDQLIQAKHGLGSKLMQSVKDRMVAVNKINSLIQEYLGEGEGREVDNSTKRQIPNGDGTVALKNEELGCLGNDDSRSPTTRFIHNNVALDQALQINGPVGEMGWREVDGLTIKDNHAKGNSIQINHAVSLDVFDRLLAARAATVSSAHMES